MAFCNWCVESGRLSFNPLARLHKADEHGDRRRNRRALSEGEIGRLLKAARLRPIAEYGRRSVPKPDDQKRGRSTWTKAELTFDDLDAAYQRGLTKLEGSPERIAELTFLGEQRALMYRVMICTGLRKSELASITAGQVHLDGPYPHMELLPSTRRRAGARRSRFGPTSRKTCGGTSKRWRAGSARRSFATTPACSLCPPT